MQRVILSENAGATQFRVSKAGKAVTSTNLSDFLIHESLTQAVPEVILNITSLSAVSFNGSSGSVFCQFTYAHGLPFIPFFKSLTSYSSVTGSFPGGGTVGSSYLIIVSGNPTGGAQSIIYAYADATNVYLTMYVSGTVTNVGQAFTLTNPFLIAIFGVAV